MFQLSVKENNVQLLYPEHEFCHLKNVRIKIKIYRVIIHCLLLLWDRYFINSITYHFSRIKQKTCNMCYAFCAYGFQWMQKKKLCHLILVPIQHCLALALSLSETLRSDGPWLLSHKITLVHYQHKLRIRSHHVRQDTRPVLKDDRNTCQIT